MLPDAVSTPKNTVIEKFQEKGIGEKKARTFLDEHTSLDGPIYEWRIKRSGKRDEIHLARHAQLGFGTLAAALLAACRQQRG